MSAASLKTNLLTDVKTEKRLCPFEPIKLSRSMLVPVMNTNSTSIQFDWYLVKLTPLARYIHEVKRPVVKVHLRMNVETKNTIHLYHFSNSITGTENQYKMATVEERQAFRGLSSKTLCFALHHLSLKYKLGPNVTVQVYAGGLPHRSGSTSLKRLISVYETLGFVLDSNDPEDDELGGFVSMNAPLARILEHCLKLC